MVMKNSSRIKSKLQEILILFLDTTLKMNKMEIWGGLRKILSESETVEKVWEIASPEKNRNDDVGQEFILVLNDNSTDEDVKPLTLKYISWVFIQSLIASQRSSWTSSRISSTPKQS